MTGTTTHGILEHLDPHAIGLGENVHPDVSCDTKLRNG
jgi:hypothetical protein